MGLIDRIRKILTPTIPKIGKGPTISDTIKAIKSPSGTGSGFTPVKDSSGRIADARRTGGGGSSGGGRSPSPTGGSSGSSAASRRAAEEQARQVEQQRLEQQRQQEESRRQAEEQRRRELITVRQNRIDELQKQNQRAGILSTEQSSRRIILARERSEISQAGKQARAEAGATGDVQAAQERGVVTRVVSRATPTRRRPSEAERVQTIDKQIEESASNELANADVQSSLDLQNQDAQVSGVDQIKRVPTLSLIPSGIEKLTGLVSGGLDNLKTPLLSFKTQTDTGVSLVKGEVKKFTTPTDIVIQDISKDLTEIVTENFNKIVRSSKVEDFLLSSKISKDAITSKVEKDLNIISTGVDKVSAKITKEVSIALPDVLGDIPTTTPLDIVIKPLSISSEKLLRQTIKDTKGQGLDLLKPKGVPEFLTTPFIIPGQKIKATEELFTERLQTFSELPLVIPKNLPTLSLLDVGQPGGFKLPITKEVELITTKEFKQDLAIGGLTGQVIAPLIPETIGELALTVGALKVLTTVPPIVRIGLDVAFTPGEIKTVFDPTQDVATRIRSGIFAGLGVGGSALEGLPFVKGGLTRFKPGFTGAVDEAVDVSRLFPGGEAKVISGLDVSDIKGLDDSFDIKIIETGKGFGFTTAEQEAFLNQKVTLTTSARDLLSKTSDVLVESRETGDLGLFFTPTLGDVGEARLSRLGLSDLFKPSGFDATIGFKIEQPEIVVIRDTLVTKSGRPGTARGLGFPSGELEATLLPGTEITGGQVGTTILKGQEVKIFEAFITKTDDATSVPKIKIEGLDLDSRRFSATVDPFSLGVGTKSLFDFEVTSTTPTRDTAILTLPSISSTPTRDTATTITIPTIRTGRGGSTISTPPTTPSIIPRLPRIPRVPSVPTRILTPVRGPPEIPIPRLFKIPKSSAPRISTRGFGVQIRRGGEFFNVGRFKTQRLAFERGVKLTSESLAATFRLTSPGKVPKAPKGFREKDTPLGKLFIERRGKRLSKKGETREIQAAKKRKPKKKTKTRKKKK